MEEVALTEDQLEKLKAGHRMLKAASDLKKYNKFNQFVAYPKQLTFFAMGHDKSQRMFNAGNRLGKTEAGAFETVCHLTGDYPAGWPGVQFQHPVDAWAVGLSATATRDIIQEKLCGKPLLNGSLGTGMIPLEKFAAAPTLSRSIMGSYDTVQVRHKSGGVSMLGFKSCEQGWQKFQGTSKDWIWIDEEPDDYKIYTECITRTLDTGGLVIVTYTPLSGETSDLWQAFNDPADTAKGMVNMSANEVLAYENSHLDQAKYDQMLASWPAHERTTRASGKPSVGAGAVFTHLKQDIECPPVFEPGGYALLGWGVDFGGAGGTTLKYSHPFGAVLLAYDASADIIYAIREVRLPGGRVLEHAYAMQKMCALAPVFWPHDGHRTTNDDQTKDTRDLYKETGLKMWHEHATFKKGGYSTEAGIMELDARMSTGRLKICSNLSMLWGEYGSYSRNERGDIVKVNDDLMSALRIGVMMVPRFGRQVPLGGIAKMFTAAYRDPSAVETMSKGLNDWDIWGNDEQSY